MTSFMVCECQNSFHKNSVFQNGLASGHCFAFCPNLWDMKGGLAVEVPRP